MLRWTPCQNARVEQGPAVQWRPEILALVGSLASALGDDSAADLRIPAETLRLAFDSSQTLVHTARSHKMVSVTAAGAIRVDARVDVRTALVEAQQRSKLRALRAAASTVQVSGVLSAAGCRPIMIKGVTLSVQTTGTLDARGVGDVDVVVPPDQMHAAITAICRAGGTVRPGTDAHDMADGHAVTVDWRGTSVDIHRRLAHAPVFCLPPHAGLWERSVDVGVGGATVRALAPADAAVHIAMNSEQDTWSQLIRLADLARLLRIVEGAPGQLAPDQVARSWGASRQWALGLAMLRRLRSDLPRQDRLTEALATRAWLWLATGRQLRLSSDLSDKVTRDLFRVASARSPAYTRWWLGQGVRRLGRGRAVSPGRSAELLR